MSISFVDETVCCDVLKRYYYFAVLFHGLFSSHDVSDYVVDYLVYFCDDYMIHFFLETFILVYVCVERLWFRTRTT